MKNYKKFITLLAGTMLAAIFFTSATYAAEVTINFNGHKLDADFFQAQGKGPDAPTILLTHGTLAHNRMEIIKAFESQLLELGFNTLAINLSLGIDSRHGMYDCKTPHRHTHREAIDEIGAWVKWLENKGATQIILFGHSRGANQTAWYAAEHHDAAIKKVVLVAPMTWSMKGEKDAYHKRYGKQLGPILARAKKLVAEGKGEQMMKDVDFIYCPKTTVSARAFADYYANDPRFDTPSLLKKIKQPVLVIAGSADTTEPGVIKKVEPLVDDEHINLVVIDGAGHFFRDLYTDEAVDAIAHFIRD